MESRELPGDGPFGQRFLEWLETRPILAGANCSIRIEASDVGASLDLCIQDGRSVPRPPDSDHRAVVYGPVNSLNRWVTGEVDVTEPDAGITVGGNIIALAVFSGVLPDPLACHVRSVDYS